MRLSAIHLYPVKSAAGLAPSEWEVDGFGLRHDRRWMVVDDRGVMISQRTHPRLALVRPTIGDEVLRLEAPGMPALELPLSPADGQTTSATVWDDTCTAVRVGDGADAWWSQVLDTRCGLVYMPDNTVRPADPVYAPPGARVSFADGFAFLLISEESLADLNHRLSAPVPMNRFRPNLVVAGTEAYGEDRLTRFQIGRVDFQVVKPCDRCVLTTTDQLTLERGPEPLRTLATYRRQGGKVLFGQNVVHRGTGPLRLGDPLQV